MFMRLSKSTLQNNAEGENEKQKPRGIDDLVPAGYEAKAAANAVV